MEVYYDTLQFANNLAIVVSVQPQKANKQKVIEIEKLG